MENNEKIIKCLQMAINENEMLCLGFLSKYFKVCPFNGDKLDDMLIRRLFNADKETRKDFIDFLGEYAGDEYGLRVCDNCGEFTTEGYLLNGYYACSEDCAVAIYKDKFEYKTEEEAKEALNKDLEEDDNECLGETYWTDFCDVSFE